MPYRHGSDTEPDSSDSDYNDAPVPLAPRAIKPKPALHTVRPSQLTVTPRVPRSWAHVAMPPTTSRQPKEDQTFNPQKYKWDFNPYPAKSSALGYEGLLQYFPPQVQNDDNDGHVKRVSNMFFVFRTHFTKTYKDVVDPQTGRSRDPIPEKDISKIAAWVWNFRMTVAARRPYFDTYMQLKHEFDEAHPNYKYQPTKPVEAERLKKEKEAHRKQELQRKKEETEQRRREEEEERKRAKVSKKMWAHMKREERNNNRGTPELRLNTPAATEYASASPLTYTASPFKSNSHLNVDSPSIKAQSRSPAMSMLKEPSPLPMASGWNEYQATVQSQAPSRQGTPGIRQPIEVPKLAWTSAAPQSQRAIYATPQTPQNGLGLHLPSHTPMSAYPSTPLDAPLNVPSSFSPMTPVKTPVMNNNAPSSFANQNYQRPMASLPTRANDKTANYNYNPSGFDDGSSQVPNFMNRGTQLPTPPQTAPAKRARVVAYHGQDYNKPKPLIYGAGPRMPSGNDNHVHAPVTPLQYSNSINQQRFLWGVSPSEKSNRGTEYSARSEAAPEETNDARSMISPRQANGQQNTAEAYNDDPFIVTQQPVEQRHKRKVSDAGQGGRSRVPSYSEPEVGRINELSESESLAAGVLQSRLENVYTQKHALGHGFPSAESFSHVGRQRDVTDSLLVNPPSDIADWMVQGSMDYPQLHEAQAYSDPRLSNGNIDCPADADVVSPAGSLRTHRSNSTDAYDLIHSLHSGFTGEDFDRSVAPGFNLSPVGTMGIMAPVRRLGSLSDGRNSDAGLDRGMKEESDAMEQYFDFESGSSPTGSEEVLHSVSPFLEATAY